MSLSAEEIEKRLRLMPEWRLHQGALVKEFNFKDFKDAFRFMSAVSEIAEALNHHPDWSNSYNKVSVSLMTHSQAGLTDADFTLAQKMDERAQKTR